MSEKGKKFFREEEEHAAKEGSTRTGDQMLRSSEIWLSSERTKLRSEKGGMGAEPACEKQKPTSSFY